MNQCAKSYKNVIHIETNKVPNQHILPSLKNRDIFVMTMIAQSESFGSRKLNNAKKDQCAENHKNLKNIEIKKVPNQRILPSLTETSL